MEYIQYIFLNAKETLRSFLDPTHHYDMIDAWRIRDSEAGNGNEFFGRYPDGNFPPRGDAQLGDDDGSRDE